MHPWYQSCDNFFLHIFHSETKVEVSNANSVPFFVLMDSCIRFNLHRVNPSPPRLLLTPPGYGLLVVEAGGNVNSCYVFRHRVWSVHVLTSFFWEDESVCAWEKNRR